MTQYDRFKDTLIVSTIFFLATNDWLDNWLRETFPQLRTLNPLVFTLIKTLIFGGFYYVYLVWNRRLENGKAVTASADKTG